MIRFKKILLSSFLVLTYFFASADKLEKGFERLHIYDYFLAKEYFQNSLKDKAAGASYGLSIIFSTNNNPFYNLDSARVYILNSDTSYRKLQEKEKPYYSKLGITDSSIQAQKDNICRKAFLSMSSNSTVEILNKYISDFSFCSDTIQAVQLRNAAAYKLTRQVNTAEAYRNFISTYPDSKEMKDAQHRYDERLFAEFTADKSLNSYVHFLNQYPKNPYRVQAERMIYSLSAPNKTIEEYYSFIKTYSSSRYVIDAWREIYKLSMKNYSEQALENFKNRFPDYPFKNELAEDYKLQSAFLLPFNKNRLWGFIDEEGKEFLKPVYDEVALFSEGLAAAEKNGKYGFINKAGKTIIPFVYDDAESFHNNAAVVKKNGKYGLIDRNQEELIPIQYDDLTEPSEDICVAVLNERSGYVLKNGKKLIESVFDLANDFKDGFAITGADNQYGLLNNEGTFSIEQKYDELIFIADGLLKAKQNSRWGILNTSGEIILPLGYDAIGELHENRVLIEKNKKCGFADANGKIIIPLNYIYEGNMLTTAKFKNGYAVLSQKDKSILIDTLGTKILLPGFEDIGSFSEGLVPVKKNKKWGFADLNGKIKISCKYEYANAFDPAYAGAKIRLKKATGIIDKNGNLIVEPLYDNIEFANNYFIVKSKDETLGLISREGKTLLPVSAGYDRIEFISDKIAVAFVGEKRTYLNLDTGKIIWSEVD